MKFINFYSYLASLFMLLPAASYTDVTYPATGTVFVPYANTTDNPGLSKSPTIKISLDGSEHIFPIVMDTGSVGIVVSSDLFTPAPGAKDLGKGEQFYTSSGIIEEGRWWSATQKIYDGDGNLLATSNVPVLRVTSIKCAKDARGCKPNKHPKRIALMGIGFARESKTQPRGTPEYNAFLNLKTIAQNGQQQPLPDSWVNGYVVTPVGVFLGLTSGNTANAGFVKLKPWEKYTKGGLQEWKPAPMTLTVNGVSGNGHVLMDTGVGTAYMTPPPTANLGPLVDCSKSGSKPECLPDGTVVKAYFPDHVNPVAYYTFTVGQSNNAMEPSSVHHVKGKKVFLNTSRHVLGGFNFIYDNTHGYMGYIWNGLSSGSVGYVTPTPPH